MSLHVVAVGRLTKDPFSKDSFTVFSIASNDYAGGSAKTSFRDVKMFGPKAQYAATYFTKGVLVEVRGKEVDEEYNGVTRATIYGDDCSLLSKTSSNGETEQPDSGRPKPNPKPTPPSPVKPGVTPTPRPTPTPEPDDDEPVPVRPSRVAKNRTVSKKTEDNDGEIPF